MEVNMQEPKNESPGCAAGYIRAHELPARYPVLKRSTWMSLVATGAIPSVSIGRARVLRVADVEAYLSGSMARTGGTDG